MEFLLLIPVLLVFTDPIGHIPRNRGMTKHRWDYCDLCEINIVLCGTCGNNTCNGGYGEVDGKECSDCPYAYDEWLEGQADTFRCT